MATASRVPTEREEKRITNTSDIPGLEVSRLAGASQKRKDVA
jgi:hypothetical protein